METKIAKSDWIFLFLCLLLGILAEEAFFRSEIGISYLLQIFTRYLCGDTDAFHFHING
jgi:hypothetical protein